VQPSVSYREFLRISHSHSRAANEFGALYHLIELWAVDVAEPLPRLPLANAQTSIRPRHDHVRVAAKCRGRLFPESSSRGALYQIHSGRPHEANG
jgi:hypothetical protein